MMFEARPATARYETVVHGDRNLERFHPAGNLRARLFRGGSNVLTRTLASQTEAVSLVEDGVHDGFGIPIQGVTRVFTPQRISRCLHCRDTQTGVADFGGLVAGKEKNFVMAFNLQ
jgi:hypothetical protein